MFEPSVRPCWRCGTYTGVTYRPSMTRYHFEGELNSDEDPNRAHEMCQECFEEYHAYWAEMWAEYRASQRG